MQASPSELDSIIERVANIARQFNISTKSDWGTETTGVEILDTSNITSDKTFGCLSSNKIDLTGPLSEIRKVFERFDYSEKVICDLLNIESLQAIEPTHLSYYDNFLLEEDSLSDLVRLFQLRALVPKTRVEKIFSREIIQLMMSLGLLSCEDKSYSGNVDIFSTNGFLIATDHRYMICEGDELDEEPVMYIGMDSHGLVQTAPRDECEMLLDLCCGSGVQGIVSSRYSNKVIAVDINPRAIRFTRFNAQLNGLSNHEVREGSLYEPVKGLKFDCILANPPFVPSPDTNLMFRDGGSNGESILQAIVKGAPTHLKSDGRFAIVTDLVDISKYSDKLRSWLSNIKGRGVILTTADRDEILFSVPHCHAPFNQSFDQYNKELECWINNFRGAGLKAVNFGYIIVWLDDQTNMDLTLRTIHNPSTPIWHNVQEWINQRKRWNTDQSHEFLVRPRDGLLSTITKSVNEDYVDIQLTVADENPFFTDYQIENDMMDEIKRMSCSKLTLAEYQNTSHLLWIEELHRLGLLILTPKKPESKDENSGKSLQQKIIQKSTKTTPTCLSSYLG